MDNTAYASVFERLIARVIDKIIVTAPLYLILTGPMDRITKDAIMGCALLVYVVALTYLWNGQTPGKKIMKIKIASAKDQKLSLGHYAWREITFNLFPLFLIQNQVIQALWMIWILTSVGLIIKGDRGIHDFAAKTVVISTREL